MAMTHTEYLEMLIALKREADSLYTLAFDRDLLDICEFLTSCMGIILHMMKVAPAKPFKNHDGYAMPHDLFMRKYNALHWEIGELGTYIMDTSSLKDDADKVLFKIMVCRHGGTSDYSTRYDAYRTWLKDNAVEFEAQKDMFPVFKIMKFYFCSPTTSTEDSK
jgi:hypothetical protein